MPQLIDNLLAVRTNIAAIFIRTAFRNNPEKSIEVLAEREKLKIIQMHLVIWIITFFVVLHLHPVTRSMA